VEGLFVPLGLFAAITIILSFAFWFKYRARSEMQATIRTSIEQGQELTPEIVDRLGNPAPPKYKDLRLALIWLAIAAGLSLCGFFVPDPNRHALQGCLAGAPFPFCIGVAYLIMWRFTSNER
jgi:hypothetical protein